MVVDGYHVQSHKGEEPMSGVRVGGCVDIIMVMVQAVERAVCAHV